MTENQVTYISNPILRQIFITVIVCLNSYFLFGQKLPDHLHYIQFTEKEGLSSNTVYDIIQNQNGEIILGTSDGISLYNGLGFRNYSYRGKGRALQNFQKLAGDSSVLASSFFGDIVKFKNNEFSQLVQQESNVAKNVLLSINDSPYTTTNNGIKKLEDKTAVLNFSENLLNVLQIVNLPDKSFWMLSRRDQVYAEKYDSDFNLVSRYIIDNPVQNPILYQLNDDFFVFSDNVIYQIEENKLSKSKVQLDFKFQKTKWLGLNIFNDSLIVLNGFDGVFIFNSNGMLLHRLFEGISISKSYQDIEDNYWFCSLQDGVFMLPTLQLNDIDLTGVLSKQDKVFRTQIRNNGEIILASIGGKLLGLNSDLKLIKSLQLPRKAEIQSMTVDEKSAKLWVFCDGIFEIDLNKFSILRTIDMVSTKNLKLIEGKLFCATSRGLYIISDSNQHYLGDVWINAMYELDSLVILGTVNGIYLYDKYENTIKKDERYKIKEAVVLRVFSSTSGRIFLQTLNNGILEWNISSVIEVEIGNFNLGKAENLILIGDLLYCTINNNIHEFDLKENKLISIYDKSFGIESSEPVGIYKTKLGLIFIYPKKIQLTTGFMGIPEIKPWIKFRSVTANFINNNTDILPFENNFIEILADVHPNIKSGGKTKMFYSLNSGEWQEAQTMETGYTLRYQNLAPGKFELSFKALSNSGLSSDIKTLNFHVKYPFWQSAYFIIGMISLFILVTYLIYFRRTQILKSKTEKFLEEEKLKSRLLLAELTAIRSQMNPHFIFNVMSAIQSEILKGESRKAYHDLNQFSKLLRTILERSSKEYSSLKEEIEMLELYLELEKNRFEDDFEFSINMDQALEEENVEIPTLITQPFVENAIKHGLMHKRGKKTLDISIRGNENQYFIEIQDNGIGRKKSGEINTYTNKPKSFATEAIKNRIERINQQGIFKTELRIEDLESGTKVKLTIKKND